MNFGAFVEIAPGKEGLVHISKLDTKRVERVEDVAVSYTHLMKKAIKKLLAALLAVAMVCAMATVSYTHLRRPALCETVKLMEWVFDSFSIQAALDTDLTLAEIPVKYSSDTSSCLLYTSRCV